MVGIYSLTRGDTHSHRCMKCGIMYGSGSNYCSQCGSRLETSGANIISIVTIKIGRNEVATKVIPHYTSKDEVSCEIEYIPKNR